jgi:hypothetical protein
MKKTVFILVIIFAALIISEKGHAQFALGLKAGYNASKLNTNIDSIKSSINSGFHIGAFARIGNRVHLQPEFYYTLSGGTFENIGLHTVNDWKQKVTVGTLDIPVMIGFEIINSSIFKWRIMAGPEASFVINSKIEDVSLTGPIEKSNLHTTNWYIQAGTGIDVLFLTLDIRYQTGLNSLITEVTGTDGTKYSVDSKGNLFVVSVGFKIL